MRINDSQTATSVLRHFDGIRSRSAKTFRQVSSGETVNRVGDDNVALHKSTKLRSQIDGADRAVKNAQDAVSLVQVADGGIEGIVDVLQKLRRLALQSANDSNGDDDRKVIEAEFAELTKEIDRQSSAISYNGKHLLNGSLTAPLRFQVGANQSEVIKLSLSTVTKASLGLNNLSVETRVKAESTLALFDTAIRSLSEKRAELGGISNRLTYGEGYLETLRQNNASANSKIKDLDLADGAENLAKNKVMIETAASALQKSSMTNAALATLAPMG
jgi:flagellin